MRIVTVFLVVLLLGCQNNDDDDLSFEVQGRFTGQVVSSSFGVDQIDITVRRAGENRVRIEQDSLSLAAEFEAEIIDVEGELYFEIPPEEYEGRFIRGTDDYDGYDGRYNDVTGRIEYQINVAGNAAFTGASTETFTGIRPIN
jgi:hypothetical protein